MYLRKFFKKYIENTAEKTEVADHKICLCGLTKAVMEGINIDHPIKKNVYITTKCLKHLFDKKPAEEFFFIVNHLHKVVKYPDKIYKNKNGKRGEFCLMKEIENEKYLCSIEIVSIVFISKEKEVEEREIKEIQIATAFRLRDEKYIKNYTLLWDWGNGNPHRSALDTPVKESTNAPQ